MTDPLHPEVAEQMADVVVASDRPLVITDADEVVVNFIDRFADFLPEYGFSFTWASYHLTGNVVRDNGRPAGKDDMARVFHAFYDTHAADLDPVPGAVETLGALAQRATVIVLSNLPLPHRFERARGLALHGLDVPVIANIGRKGPAVRALAEQTSAPVFFLDDSPRHHESVAQSAPAVIRLHFVGHPRLARLIDQAPDSHHRTDDWPSARAVIDSHLDDAGF